MSWATSYAKDIDLASWLRIDADDAELALVCDAASRAVDRATGRQFGVTEPEERTYQAEHFRGRTLVNIDDLMTTDDLLIEVDGTEVTDFTLCPPNASQKGKPWTHLTIPGAVHGWVVITARWGQPTPEAIKMACLIQAGRWYDRRTNPAGSLTTKRVDVVEYQWSAAQPQDLDPDVLASIAPFRKLWFAF